MNVLKTAFLFVLIGCATTMKLPEVDVDEAEHEAYRQRVAAWRKEAADNQRFSEIAFSIRRDNVKFCKRKAFEIGITYATIDQHEEVWRDVARTEGKITERLTVLTVARESAAAAAGLLPGDKIVRVNGEDIGVGPKAREEFKWALEDHEKQNMSLNVWRDGETHSIETAPSLVCKYPFYLIRQDDLNAWTDGQSVFFTTAMLRFVKSDDALALILGHELAHITLGHVRKQITNTVIGAAIGAVVSELLGEDVMEEGAEIGSMAYSQDFETEADYVGAYFAARSGFDVENAAKVWWRIAMEYPESIDLEGSTHPSTAIRHVALKQVAEEIRKKSDSQKPLEPDSKD